MQTDTTKKWLDKKGAFAFKVLFFIYFPLLLFMTLMPADLVSSGGDTWISKLNLKNGDKVIHFTLFFIFTLLLYFSGLIKKKYMLLAIPISVGVLIEILQHLMGLGRSFELLDILANSLGALTAYWIFNRRV